MAYGDLVSTARMNFARANLKKILSLPLFLSGLFLSWFVPRESTYWIFGSGVGVGEGALPVAQEIRRRFPEHRITWCVQSDDEAASAETQGLEWVKRNRLTGWWATIRAGHIVVTHGLGDVNRYGIFRAEVTHLMHGAPLKKLHLDSPITTSFSGPRWLALLLRKMYLTGSGQFSLIVAGSALAATRLRSAYRVLPGKVIVLGDPRDDIISSQMTDVNLRNSVRTELYNVLGISQGENSLSREPKLFLYAPTWRDGDSDPAIPDQVIRERLQNMLVSANAHLVIRPHPLGIGSYQEMLSDRVHMMSGEAVREITPLLCGFDLLITDYSSIAVDYALCEQPILWFAPDRDKYMQSRGLYEPLEVTAIGKVSQTWEQLSIRIENLLLPKSVDMNLAVLDAKHLKRRFHSFPHGGAARRVCDEIIRLSMNDESLIPGDAVFFESFYGKQISCNPAAIDGEISKLCPEVSRYWSITHEEIQVPEGAIGVLVGSPEWYAARRRAQLLIVNDWTRYNFKPRSGQTVLQTWHGTMLKQLALGRPNVNFRTRLAIRRESKRWSLLLSQNTHSTQQFRTSYGYRGEILELGYPRTDALANSLAGDQRSPILVAAAKRKIGVPEGSHVLSYAPTWREHKDHILTELDVERLATQLGPNWTVLTRAHTRSCGAGNSFTNTGRVIDVSQHPDINDVIIAADLFVTDYSSSMFDASVANVPLAFFVPDIQHYQDEERGFTFDFESSAPGQLCFTTQEIIDIALDIDQRGQNSDYIRKYSDSAESFRMRFTPYDDGRASFRVVQELIRRGILQSVSLGS